MGRKRKEWEGRVEYDRIREQEVRKERGREENQEMDGKSWIPISQIPWCAPAYTQQQHSITQRIGLCSWSRDFFYHEDDNVDNIDTKATSEAQNRRRGRLQPRSAQSYDLAVRGHEGRRKRVYDAEQMQHANDFETLIKILLLMTPTYIGLGLGVTTIQVAYK